MVVMNPHAMAEAEASDARRARGETLGPLDGIPYTAKNSYLAKGLTAASGSPAFEHLVAQHDAFAVERLRAGGAVLIGLTNMPPMANGGVRRGVYGRAESPYSADWLTSAYGSGSSNGSGTATAASFGAFGLGEETWSSGRAPASNNALCAYTPEVGRTVVELPHRVREDRRVERVHPLRVPGEDLAPAVTAGRPHLRLEPLVTACLPDAEDGAAGVAGQRHREDRRHAVDGEDEVGCLDRGDHRRRRGGDPPAPTFMSTKWVPE
ncbi:Glutamyl-tRNA(Gln) amidotransferase subunit A, chloroplastic/mitochondrial [Streptomyces californicus]